MEYLIEPYAWQHELIRRCNEQKNFAILADMGTGKTGGMINVLRHRYAEYGRVVNTLIVTPLVTLHNWKREFGIHSKIPQGAIYVISGSTDQKLKRMNKALPGPWIMLINYEAFTSPKIVKFLQDSQIDIMVLDEAHSIKNHKAKRSKTIKSLSMKCKNRYIMTGTLLANSVEDVFMPFYVMDDGATFGDNFYTFQRTYMKDMNARWSHLQSYFPDWKPNPDRLPELKEKIASKSIRVLKSECLDLPERERIILPVELSKEQRTHYDNVMRDYFTLVPDAAADGAVVAQTALTRLLRLQQIVTGYVGTIDGREITLEDNPRLDALMELVTSRVKISKIIVWCAFKENYRTICKALDAEGIRWVKITGEESIDEKEEAQNLFNNDDDVRVAVCNRKAAGIGINLVQSNYSITFSRNFSRVDEAQSLDRNYRGGSEIHDEIIHVDLCAFDTVDEETTNALATKKEISTVVLDYVNKRRGDYATKN